VRWVSPASMPHTLLHEESSTDLGVLMEGGVVLKRQRGVLWQALVDARGVAAA
jgi:hypothetical protein